jgi:hypothetical protein
VESFAFLATLQRLGFIAQELEKTDVAGLLEHLTIADTVAPVMGGDPDRLREIRRFVELTIEYQRVCRTYHDRMAAAEQTAGRIRRQLVAPAPSPPAPPASAAEVEPS